MKEFKENKKIIMICAGIILLALLLLLFYNRDQQKEDKYEVGTDSYLKNYQINEAIPVVIDDEGMAQTYLAEYVSLMLNDPEQAYSLLEPAYRDASYPTLQSFKNYLAGIESIIFYQGALAKYEVKREAGYRVFTLYDKANNFYIFKESSIMNYTVSFK